MHGKTVTLAGLIMAGLVLASVAACGQQSPSVVAGTAAVRLTGSPQPVHVTASPQPVHGSPSPVGKSPETGGTKPASATGPQAGAPTSAASSPSGQSSQLTSGMYVDGPDGTPHYVLALARSGSTAITGTVSYLYQDGKISAVGQYSGKLSDGRLTVTFSNGRDLTGTYGSGRLALSGCASQLTWAVHPADCQFTYNGHTP